MGKGLERSTTLASIVMVSRSMLYAFHASNKIISSLRETIFAVHDRFWPSPPQILEGYARHCKIYGSWNDVHLNPWTLVTYNLEVSHRPQGFSVISQSTCVLWKKAGALSRMQTRRSGRGRARKKKRIRKGRPSRSIFFLLLSFLWESWSLSINRRFLSC